jgi:DNA-binding NtrC family response regulator
MLPSREKVLIIDDDPTHLEIYGMLMQQAGYEPVFALVRFASTDIPRDPGIGLVLLDYRLNSMRTSVEIARDLQAMYPFVPIVLLSDVWGLPSDIAPYVTAFVRKGETEKLLRTLGLLLPVDDEEGQAEAVPHSS